MTFLITSNFKSIACYLTNVKNELNKILIIQERLLIKIIFFVFFKALKFRPVIRKSIVHDFMHPEVIKKPY